VFKALSAATLVLGMVCLARVSTGGAGRPEAEPATDIQPGTALAKLVEESEAHPVAKFAAAANTGTGHRIRSEIPVWLRAHYMRNHPHVLAAAQAKDPTGGFPLALDTLFAWMLRHQDLKPSAVVEVKAAAAVALGVNVRVSGENKNPRSESDIRINFKDGNKIVAASNDVANGAQAQYFSHDGGASWGQTSLPLIPGDSLQSDPTVDWTSDGTAWATTIGINAGATSLQMRSYKSIDDGVTWTFDSTFSGDQTSADKQMMTVDHGPSSQFRDNIYLIWHNANPAFVNRRTAGGFGAPLQVSGAETTGTAIGSDITTNWAGDVFAVWPDTGSQKLFFVKSDNGGQSYSSPQQVGNVKTFGSFQVRVPAFAQRGALIGVSIGAFRDDSRNDLYVSWMDLSGEPGCDTPESEPGEDVQSSCKTRVFFVRSEDGGVNWGPPEKINDDEQKKSDQFNQKLVVDPATGSIGIVYYQTGTDANRKKTDLVFQFSTDYGKSFGKPLRVSTETTDETAAGADTGNQYGDYNGLSVLNGEFFPSWTDRRDNKAEAIFTSKIALSTIRNGAR
jgi:hypothetical protein